MVSSLRPIFPAPRPRRGCDQRGDGAARCIPPGCAPAGTTESLHSRGWVRRQLQKPARRCFPPCDLRMTLLCFTFLQVSSVTAGPDLTRDLAVIGTARCPVPPGQVLLL